MLIKPKTSYHPYLLVAFYLNCLPVDLLQRIPRSTRHEWSHKDQFALYGHEWYLENKHLFGTLQEVAANKQLLRVNRALLRVIALKRFMELYQDRIKYPGQLLLNEINVIRGYCTDSRYVLWPLASIFHQIRRDGAAYFTISTFYKYVDLLGLKRRSVRHRRKNNQVGIRASAPLQILHAGTTVFRTANNRKSYIHLVQDNYSRMILSYRVAESCKADNTFSNLESAVEKYLIPSGITSCMLLTDDGSENAGAVRSLIESTLSPHITHLIAQRDIEFSNSMIEAVNKQLKYRFLYHQYIANHAALDNYVEQGIEDFNNRPHDVLDGLTPPEVVGGKAFDLEAWR